VKQHILNNSELVDLAFIRYHGCLSLGFNFLNPIWWDEDDDYCLDISSSFSVMIPR